jgi:hypothetical protein
MLERDGFPPGVPAWIDTSQDDPDAAASFYGGLFGWQFDARGASYRVATLDGKDVAGLRSRTPAEAAGTSWTTYMGTDDVDAAADRVREAGGSVVVEPAAVDGAGRAAICTDPSGATFGLWEPGSIKGAQAVNAPGSWNFSELNTSDTDTARRFYGAVFGWEADEVDMGALSGLMVRMPGYADFLEQFDPGIRQRHADFGAPPGFSECVAWILPLQEGSSPHWSITFSVADTDAVADAARRLGGTVLVEPFDVPPVRSAVLGDPAGAVLTVSAFNPG